MLPRTQQALDALEKAVCENAGDLVRACRSLGVNPYDLYQWKLADPEVASTIKAAQLVGYASLESEAYRRAVLGVEEDIYFKGEVVGSRVVYSDGLLQTMLKARVPGYQSDESGPRGLTVNVAIMPRAANYEEWLEHKQKALPSPENVQDAEYSEVSDAAKAAYVLMRPSGGLPDVL
jgi:hypothetical protein